MASIQAMRRAALQARAIVTANRLTGRKRGPPDLFQIRFDVRVTLRTALRADGVKEKDIKDAWKPKDAGYDEGGWEVILAGFASDLRDLSSVYKGYRHQPRYTVDTISKALSAIEDHLSAEVAKAVAQTAAARAAATGAS